MTLQMLYFAGVGDLIGRSGESLEWSTESGATVAQLASLLRKRYPRLTLEGVRFAVNEEFVDLERKLATGDVVALIPPVSGG